MVLWTLHVLACGALLRSALASGAGACLYNYAENNGQDQGALCEAHPVPAGLKVIDMTRRGRFDNKVH